MVGQCGSIYPGAVLVYGVGTSDGAVKMGWGAVVIFRCERDFDIIST